MKEKYEAPVLTVIEVEDDIITASPPCSYYCGEYCSYDYGYGG